MKKIMFMAAAIAIATVTQANVVDWGYTITGDKTVNSAATAQASAYANNYTIYLFAADAVADWTQLTSADLALAKDHADLEYQNWTSRGGATYATADSTGNVGAARTFDVGDAASYSAMMVVYDNVNNTYAYEAMNIASRSETAGAGTEGIDSKSQTAFAAQTFTPVSGGGGGGGGSGTIPEPTSGLLMLVGLGALALRRKR